MFILWLVVHVSKGTLCASTVRGAGAEFAINGAVGMGEIRSYKYKKLVL